MENLLAHYLKLLTIFIGSGLSTLFAYWLAKEVSQIPKLILDCDKKTASDYKVSVTGFEKISASTGLYEISLPGQEKIKLFSSHKEIKRL